MDLTRSQMIAYTALPIQHALLGILNDRCNHQDDTLLLYRAKSIETYLTKLFDLLEPESVQYREIHRALEREEFLRRNQLATGTATETCAEFLLYLERHSRGESTNFVSAGQTDQVLMGSYAMKVQAIRDCLQKRHAEATRDIEDQVINSKNEVDTARGTIGLKQNTIKRDCAIRSEGGMKSNDALASGSATRTETATGFEDGLDCDNDPKYDDTKEHEHVSKRKDVSGSRKATVTLNEALRVHVTVALWEEAIIRDLRADSIRSVSRAVGDLKRKCDMISK